MKHQTISILIFLIIVFLYSPATALDDLKAPTNENAQGRMAHHMESSPQLPTTTAEDSNSAIARFYQLVGNHAAWTGPNGLLPQGKLLLQKITNASTVGLSTNDYLLPEIGTEWVHVTHGLDKFLSTAHASYIQLDALLTDRILHYAKHLHQGRINPEQVDRPWQARRRSMDRDIPYELAQALTNNRFESFIESLHPQSAAYRRLMGALRQYEAIRRSGGWLPIDDGPTLRQGDSGPRVAMLKYHLKLTGDGFDDHPIINDGFDENVTIAVKRFQHRHGLKEDGQVGKKTLAELNIPVEQRIRQLQLNMERWRWLPDSFGDRYLMVNIPAFELTIVDSGCRVDGLRAIVGRKTRQTPILSDRMTYIELNPYWNVPQKIARRDILPKIKNDPAYLIRQGIRIFDSWDRDAQELNPMDIDWNRLSRGDFPYRLRQDPSRRNALGQIKFIFPNPRSIYIHDTPGKALFNRQQRTFSSGCVRLEDPITLATHLLSAQGWNRERIEAMIDSEERKAVILDKPIPVHLVYFTAWVDEQQRINFRKDIYGHDARLTQALRQPAPDLIARGESPVDKNLMAAATTGTDRSGSLALLSNGL